MMDLSKAFMVLDKLDQGAPTELVDFVAALQDTKKMEKKVIHWLQFKDATYMDNNNLRTQIKELTKLLFLII